MKICSGHSSLGGGAGGSFWLAVGGVTVRMSSAVQKTRRLRHRVSLHA